VWLVARGLARARILALLVAAAALCLIGLGASAAGCATAIEGPTAVIEPVTGEQPVGSVVQLDGSKSSDPQGLALGFAWRFDEVPAGSVASFTAADTAKPSFVVDRPGAYRVALIVSNGTLASAPATAEVKGGACTATAPAIEMLAAAPGSPGIGQLVSLSATVTDPGKAAACAALSYAWSLAKIPAGSQAALGAATTATPSLVPDVAGSYTVTLVVSDGIGRVSAPASLDVEVGACTAEIAASPMAPNIGQEVELTATVSAAMSAECAPAAELSYAWSLEAAPTGSKAQLGQPKTPNATLTPDLAGDYGIKLVVRNAAGVSLATATATVTAADCGGAVPVVDAITPAPAAPNLGDTVSLSATVTDADASPPCSIPQSFSYAWSILAAPAGSKASLNLASLESPSFVADQKGTYVVGLVVTDATDRKSVLKTQSITTNESCGGNTPSVTSITPSPATPNTGDTVQLTAVIDDADTQAPCNLTESFGHQWALLAAPAGSNASLNLPQAANPSFVADVSGDYVVGLVVADTAQHKSPLKTQTVTVSTCGEADPIARVEMIAPEQAGPGTAVTGPKVATGATVQLSGAASTDPDEGGTCNLTNQKPFTYSWSFLELPAGSGASLNNDAVVNPSVETDVDGKYVLALVVTDATGRSSAQATISFLADSAINVNVVAGFTVVTVASGAAGGLNQPRGIARDGAGAIYVVNNGNSRIRKVSGGAVSTLTTGGLLSGLEDIVFDPGSGTLIVSSPGGVKLVRVTLAGVQSTCLDAGDPRGVAVYTASCGPRLLVSDRASDRIAVLDPATCMLATPTALLFPPGTLSNPWGVEGAVVGAVNTVFAVDEAAGADLRRNVGGAGTSASTCSATVGTNDLLSDGPTNPRDVVSTLCPGNVKLMVAEFTDGEITFYDNATGTSRSLFASGFNAPVGLLFESATSLLVTDEDRNALYRITGTFCAL
jgi:hypothetical protein